MNHRRNTALYRATIVAIACAIGAVWTLSLIGAAWCLGLLP